MQVDRRTMAWFRKAAKHGDADAQYLIGLLYNRGEGVPKNNKRAKSWMRKAAKNGLSKAREWLRTHEKSASPP